MRTRGAPLLAAIAIAAASLMTAPVTGIAPAPVARAASPYVDPHFREDVPFTGLVNPTSIEFAADGRAFVAEKRGIVKAYDSINDSTPTQVVDIRTDVMDFWDRGLLGMVLDPKFLAQGQAARPYIYLYYVYNAPPGQLAPVWTDDLCPGPQDNPIGPGSTSDGCVVTSKLVRYEVDTDTNVVVPGSRLELLHDWCTQFPSHSGGGMTFGDDGQL